MFLFNLFFFFSLTTCSTDTPSFAQRMVPVSGASVGLDLGLGSELNGCDCHEEIRSVVDHVRDGDPAVSQFSCSPHAFLSQLMRACDAAVHSPASLSCGEARYVC